ncbi:STAS domain-containing protein [Aneurinibacillus sp. Ricciae_BoGa-3]|uniref:STAS domain-containing protein n=1 Tax=Aneurinibacillus sp. Ricciae_BoGa-3 TaxID=3022697 RepID=UPI002341E285|nr:STAS domain-containing protein [Aneurinibacillus sp. Ricciae_BoGa-3]WCK56459.1 STAS domain-containing protein [Aneurinibacillus sp. Ricciae_BoGa-3]
MNSISQVAEYLHINAKRLAVAIAEDLLQRMKFEISQQEKEQGILAYVEFLRFLSLSLSLPEGEMPKGHSQWIKTNTEREVALVGKISDAVALYPTVRMVFTEHITNTSVELNLSLEDVVFVNTRLNYMFDISINETIQTFERLKDTIIKEAQDEINDLSAPVVPFHDGIAVLPLIGSIDSRRARYLLEQVVPKITRSAVDWLIIDFSGILIIDTAVANHIFKIHEVLRMLGIHAIATGIRPELAQTVVNGGIDFSSIKTYANVKQAIDSIKKQQ